MATTSFTDDSQMDETRGDVSFLALETGIPGDRRRDLEPGHEHFDLFRGVYREQQGRWSFREHRAFWRAGLSLWPRAGRPDLGVIRAYAIRAAMVSAGLDRQSAMDGLGLSGDSLRHGRCEDAVDRLLKQREPDDPAWFYGMSVGDANVPLPAIYVPGVDGRPDPFTGYVNLAPEQLNEQTHPEVERLACELRRLRSRSVAATS